MKLPSFLKETRMILYDMPLMNNDFQCYKEDDPIETQLVAIVSNLQIIQVILQDEVLRRDNEQRHIQKLRKLEETLHETAYYIKDEIEELTHD